MFWRDAKVSSTCIMILTLRQQQDPDYKSVYKTFQGFKDKVFNTLNKHGNSEKNRKRWMAVHGG